MRPNAVRKESDFHACVIGLSTENVTRIKAIEAGQPLGRNPVKANDLSGPASMCPDERCIWDKINPDDIIAGGLLYFSSWVIWVPPRWLPRKKIGQGRSVLVVAVLVVCRREKGRPRNGVSSFCNPLTQKNPKRSLKAPGSVTKKDLIRLRYCWWDPIPAGRSSARRGADAAAAIVGVAGWGAGDTAAQVTRKKRKKWEKNKKMKSFAAMSVTMPSFPL